MQIIFDSRFDGLADAHRMRDMLTAYIASREAASGATPRSEFTGEQLRGAYEAPMLDVTSLDDSAQRLMPLPTEQPLAFTPGDMSGSAPSVAVAAQVPTAPEASTAGVPMPPVAASVPAPPSTAPVVPAAPLTSAPSGELDVNGLPWDERIHAGTKAKNADGSWRQRRGLNDPALVARVEAELRARVANRDAGPGMAEALGEDAAKLAAMGMDPLSGQPLPTGGYVPAPPPMAAGGTAANVPPPPVVATPPAPAAPDALTYDGFLAWVTPKMMDGSTPFDKVAAALSASGVSSLQELRDNPAAIPAVYQALGGA